MAARKCALCRYVITLVGGWSNLHAVFVFTSHTGKDTGVVAGVDTGLTSGLDIANHPALKLASR